MREDAKMSQFKAVIYDLNPSVSVRSPLHTYKFTNVSASVLGHWALSAEISLPKCVLYYLICFFR